MNFVVVLLLKIERKLMSNGLPKLKSCKSDSRTDKSVICVVDAASTYMVIIAAMAFLPLLIMFVIVLYKRRRKPATG
jgi:hypothetical protein